MSKADLRSQPDSDPLAQAYDRFGLKLFAYLKAILRNADAAEEVMQELFCKLARRGRRRAVVGGLSDVERVEHYLFRAAHNEARRWFRRNQLIRVETIRMDLVEAKAPERTDSHQTKIVNRALAALPTEQAEVIHLKIYAGMTFARIAHVLSCSSNTVASRYRYACEKLRRGLKELEHERE